MAEERCGSRRFPDTPRARLSVRAWSHRNSDPACSSSKRSSIDRPPQPRTFAQKDTVLAINGLPAARFSGGDFSEANAASKPTISLLVARGSARRVVTLPLRDLIPVRGI